ncbi:MAG: bifunctional precorrin-2 dehydrogenase/sirohydrochlorin ferrochelatase [Acidimicrobiales bacterium]
MRLYPVGLVLEGRPCLVVGGGPVAARKAAGLAACGAVVTVVAPEPGAEVRSLEGVRVEARPYRPGEAGDYRFVIAADAASNALVHADAEAANVFVNAADDPPRCSAVLPAVLRRGPLTVACSTGGASPALASWVRDQVAELIGPEVGEAAVTLAERRAELHARGESTEGVDWRRQIEALLR